MVVVVVIVVLIVVVAVVAFAVVTQLNLWRTLLLLNLRLTLN